MGNAQCLPSGVRHQSTPLKIQTSLSVQFRPVASLAPWGQTLCKSSILQTLASRIDPPKTECFFNDIQIRDCQRLRLFASTTHDPALTFTGMILFQPFPQLSPVRKFQQIRYFHSFHSPSTRISYRPHCGSPRSLPLTLIGRILSCWQPGSGSSMVCHPSGAILSSQFDNASSSFS